MGSGFLKNSVDLDSVFEQRSTAAIANVGHQVAGTDLAQRYEKLASGTAAAATGFKSNNNDLNTLFAAKGTVGSGGGISTGLRMVLLLVYVGRMVLQIMVGVDTLAHATEVPQQRLVLDLITNYIVGLGLLVLVLEAFGQLMIMAPVTDFGTTR